MSVMLLCALGMPSAQDTSPRGGVHDNSGGHGHGTGGAGGDADEPATLTDRVVADVMKVCVLRQRLACRRLPDSVCHHRSLARQRSLRGLKTPLHVTQQATTPMMVPVTCHPKHAPSWKAFSPRSPRSSRGSRR